MKSYQKHLIDTKSFGENLPLNYRPTMRSSAIFPLIIRKNKIESIYTFMGYWLRKRNIKVVTALITVRDDLGKKINVLSYEINSTKTFVLRSKDFFLDIPQYFNGSLEIEIFSAVDMVFPYPAITFALKGLNGITFVHSSGRVYNDFEDLNSNNEATVSETGFDIFLGKSYRPFFSFVNGPYKIVNTSFIIELIDQNNNSLVQNRNIKNIPPYGLALIDIFDENSKIYKFTGEKITAKIKHNFKGFFPRFICGNIYKNYSDISLTHSYYDNSPLNDSSSIHFNPCKEEFYDSVVSFPFDYNNFDEIELAIYPIFSKSPTTLSFEIFDLDGNILEISKTKIKISDGNDKLTYVPMSTIFENLKKNIRRGMVRVIIDGNGKVPSRMKFGLNISSAKNNNNLSSNVCFNASPPNKNLLKKTGTFKWCPIFSSSSQKIYLHNTSFIKKGFGDAKLQIEICREKDDEKLSWKTILKENCTLEIMHKRSGEVSNFLNNSIGWVTIQSSIPFITGYYITDFNKGVVGADHLF